MAKTREPLDIKKNAKSSVNIGSSASSVLSGCVKLKFVLAFYESDVYDTYVEVAMAKFGVLGSFAPCSQEWVASFARRLYSRTERVKRRRMDNESKEAKVELSALPIRFVSQNGQVIAFTAPKRKEAKLYFKGKEKTITDIPEQLYVLKDRVLHAFELLPDGMLLGLNLPNISHRGVVCMGNSVSDLTGLGTNALIKTFYDAFWSSSFNSHSDATGNAWEEKSTFRYARRKQEPFKLDIDVY